MTIKVLVVDATKTAERLCKETLLPLGCQVITASSTALGVFLARKNHPCVIINGVAEASQAELPQEILGDEDLLHIPVVLVTGEPDAGKGKLLNMDGVAKVIRLPLSPERFFEELRPYLFEKKREQRDETPE